MDFNDDGMNNGEYDEHQLDDLPELKEGQVWAGKLTIVIVKFPRPQLIYPFFVAITKALEKVCELLHIEIVQSTTGIGVGMNPADMMKKMFGMNEDDENKGEKKDKPKDDDFHLPPLDFTQFMN